MTKLNILDKKYNFLRPLKINNLIRLGDNQDGGYIVDKNVVDKCEILISLGLGMQYTFETDFIKRNKNLLIYVYDHTINAFIYIKEIWKYLRRFILFKASFKSLKTRINYYKSYRKFINSSRVKFFKEKVTVPIKRKFEVDIEKIFSRIDKKSDVVLKCDIEGSEYDIIDQILDFSSNISMLIVEFHWIDRKEEFFIESVKKLKNKFEIIHIHGNNHYQTLKNGLPIILELTLLNKKISTNNKQTVDDFPINGLDFPNNPYLEDLSFSFRD